MFKSGSRYSRNEISAQIGGSKQACLITHGGVVVGVCFNSHMNPKGPGLIFVGRGRDKERAAEILAGQVAAVPVFVKRQVNWWEYLGNYKGEQYVSPPVGYEALTRAVRHSVAGVLVLAEVG